MLGVTHQEYLRCMHQFAALARIHRCDAATERGAGAIAHFDEDHYIGIEHHQVEFSASRMRVACEQLQTMRLQVGEGDSLDCVAAGAARSYRHAVIGSVGVVSDRYGDAAGEA